MQPRTRSIGLLLGLILLCFVVPAAAAGFWWVNASLLRPSLPQVHLTHLEPEGPAETHVPQIVFARASDPQGIVKVEFWVNGELVGTQVNLEPRADEEFHASQAWFAAGPGAYTIYARAEDSRGFAANSETRLVEVTQSEMGVMGAQYIVQEGDTVDSIAAAAGATPEDVRAANPGLGAGEPPADSSITVPIPPEDGSGEDVPVGDDDTIPSVDPGDDAPPPGEDRPAAPRAGPLGIPLDLGGSGIFDDVCAGLPGLFGCPRLPRPHGTPPPAPGRVMVALAGCEVQVRWSDNADDEDGYNVYRIAVGGRTAGLILAAAPDSSMAVDHPESPGRYRYYVEVFNESGAASSLPTAEIDFPPDCPTLFIAEALDVEALEMAVGGSYDRMYCYVSLAGSPYDRVPRAASEFILNVGGSWNIADHLSGANRVSLLAPAAGPLEVAGECLGWQGGDLINLGGFARSHPRDEWDGRALTADAGGYTVTYRILPHTEGGLYPIIDTSLPAPYNLRRVNEWSDCTLRDRDFRTCALTEAPGLAWDWDAPEGRTPLNFTVFRRLPGESVPTVLSVAPWPSHAASIEPCMEEGYYSVQATMNEIGGAGDAVQSPVSEELYLERVCAALLAVKLAVLETGRLDDGCGGFLCTETDRTLEAYGVLSFNEVVMRWNSHCDPGFGEGCLTTGPSTTSIGSGNFYEWDDMWMSVTGARNPLPGFRSPNSLFFMRMGRDLIGESVPATMDLRISFRLFDHDWGSPDDLWCTGPDLTLPARTLEEWNEAREHVTLTGSVRGEGSCTISLDITGEKVYP